MRNKICLLIFFVALFIGTNVITFVGLDSNLFQAGMIAISIPLLLIRINRIVSNTPLFLLLLLIIIYSLYKLAVDTGEGTRYTILQILGAPIIFSAFPSDENEITLCRNNYSIWQLMFKVFILFFVMETGMAITERLIGYNFLGWKAEIVYSVSEIGVTEFRSTAIHGHPLYNALIVSICMSFILISPIRLKWKYILWSMGFISILCFNTRAAIVGNMLIFIVYNLHSVFVNKQIKLKIKVLMSVIMILIVICLLILIINFGFGGRLIEMGLFDDSGAQTRVDVWSLFNYVDWNKLILGYTYSEFELLMLRSGLLVTENFFIDQLFRLGYVFVCPYLILYYLVLKKLYRGYDFFDVLLTSGAFVLIASTNNSLSTNFLALLIWLWLIVLFNPKYQNYYI